MRTKKGVSHVSCDRVAFGPACERPEAFERGADKEGDAEFGDSAGGEEEPERGGVTMLLQADVGQKRVDRTDNAIDARYAQLGRWKLSTSCRPPSCNCCNFFRLRRRVPEVCREGRVLCSEQLLAMSFNSLPFYRIAEQAWVARNRTSFRGNYEQIRAICIELKMNLRAERESPGALVNGNETSVPQRHVQEYIDLISYRLPVRKIIGMH